MSLNLLISERRLSLLTVPELIKIFNLFDPIRLKETSKPELISAVHKLLLQHLPGFQYLCDENSIPILKKGGIEKLVKLTKFLLMFSDFKYNFSVVNKGISLDKNIRGLFNEKMIKKTLRRICHVMNQLLEDLSKTEEDQKYTELVSKKKSDVKELFISLSLQLEKNKFKPEHKEIKILNHQTHIDAFYPELSIIEKRGEGQYGTVYVGNIGGIKLAIKIQPTSILSEIELKFMKENQGKFFPELFGYVVETELTSILMKYYRMDLDTSIRSDEESNIPQNIPDIIGYFDTLLSIILEIRKKDYIHGDIKPSNILIGESGIVLSDFGTSTNGITFWIPTTRWFASPEILKARTLTKDLLYSNDVWSVGVTILYCLGIRTFPLAGEDEKDQLKKIDSFKKSNYVNNKLESLTLGISMTLESSLTVEYNHVLKTALEMVFTSNWEKRKDVDYIKEIIKTLRSRKLK